MAHYGSKENCNASQFFITLRGEDLSHFDQTHHTVIGEVVEGLDILEKINKLYCDEDGRPYLDVRLLHTFILDDPFPDPPNLISSGLLGNKSPDRTFPEEEAVKRRLPYESEEAITGIHHLYVAVMVVVVVVVVVVVAIVVVVVMVVEVVLIV